LPSCETNDWNSLSLRLIASTVTGVYGAVRKTTRRCGERGETDLSYMNSSFRLFLGLTNHSASIHLCWHPLTYTYMRVVGSMRFRLCHSPSYTDYIPELRSLPNPALMSSSASTPSDFRRRRVQFDTARGSLLTAKNAPTDLDRGMNALHDNRYFHLLIEDIESGYPADVLQLVKDSIHDIQGDPRAILPDHSVFKERLATLKSAVKRFELGKHLTNATAGS
jgi:hypothetical protein